MLANLTIKQELLAKYMSDICEKCYCAGWLDDLEYVLWDAVVNGERKYGQDIITHLEIDTMKLLAEETNSWIIFDNQLEETAVKLDEWKIKFITDTNAKPHLLKN